MQEISLVYPDDWHLHVRDGDVLRHVIPDTAERFARAIIMPNLKPPVTTTEQALAYRERILAAVPNGISFQPLMTLYLTDNTPKEEILKAKESGLVHALKLYPAGATTNSDAGVTDIRKCNSTLEKMAELGLPLLVHGEVTDSHIDIFDRERIFIEQILEPLTQRLPELKIVLEHITTSDAVDFVTGSGANIAATITPHHLLYNRNAMLAGGIRPHYYCLPIIKRETHRKALVKAAVSGNPKFFLGTDSAPHAQHAKESACGCAGIYSSHAAIELYAEVFEQADALDKLEGFASFYGADFYGLPRNTDKIKLTKQEWTVPDSLAFGEERLIPLRAGEKISWQLT
ncbi:MAG: dihydroorotase [Gammaproteobacteria bacterium]|nr:dihydroorotase [Gammaproteobacteria bacterium]